MKNFNENILKKSKFFLILSFSVISQQLYSQESVKYWEDHSLTIGLQYYQIKDQTNYGRIVNAGQINLEYQHANVNNESISLYGFKASFGAGSVIEYRFKPLTFALLRNLKSNELQNRFYVGPYIESNFNWQMYIPYQSVEMRWMTHYELGVKSIFDIDLRKRNFVVELSSSIVGLTSRPELSRETHFYSWDFGTFIKNAHRELELGSVNLFTHVQMKLSPLPLSSNRKWRLNYSLELISYHKNATFLSIGHQIGIIRKLGK